MMSAKPFDISRKKVLEAYRRVKANQGAAGVDDESIEMFEADLSRNLSISYGIAWPREATSRRR
jgi:RNA-directed DNA polymerase